MTEERLLQKISALQEIIPASKIEIPIPPTSFRLPINKLLADKVITSVFEDDNLTINFDKEDDVLVISIKELKPKETKTTSTSTRRRKTDADLTPADYDLFIYFMKERHNIWTKRVADKQKAPWSDDPIFQQYRFCNVFRELDAGTLWMREHFTKPNEDKPWSEIVANCGYYRMFNLIATGEFLGWISEWDTPAIIKKLAERQGAGIPLFTSAHVVRGEKGVPKIDTVCNAIGDLYEHSARIAEVAKEKQTLQSVYEELIKIRSIGGFVAYEIVTDLRHTPVLQDAFDTMTWAYVGPGAARGLKRLGYDIIEGLKHMG